jgi:hypothetical protein
MRFSSLAVRSKVPAESGQHQGLPQDGVLGECFIDADDAGTVAVVKGPAPQTVNLLSRGPAVCNTSAPFLGCNAADVGQGPDRARGRAACRLQAGKLASWESLHGPLPNMTCVDGTHVVHVVNLCYAWDSSLFNDVLEFSPRYQFDQTESHVTSMAALPNQTLKQ